VVGQRQRATVLAADRAAVASAFARDGWLGRGSAVAFSGSRPDGVRSGGEVVGTQANAATAGSPGRAAAREPVGPRLHSRIPGGLEPTQAVAPHSSLERPGHKACDALCTVMGGGANGRAGMAGVRKLVVSVAAGYELPHERRIVLRPKVQRVRGQAKAGMAVRIWGI